MMFVQPSIALPSRYPQTLSLWCCRVGVLYTRHRDCVGRLPKQSNRGDSLLSGAELGVCALATQGSLPLSFMKSLASLMRVPLQAGASLFDVVWAVMARCLPGEAESSLWEYMEARWHSPNVLESVLADGVLDQVHEDDAKEVREAAKELEKLTADMSDFRECYRTKRAKFVKQQKDDAQKQAKQKAQRRQSQPEAADPSWKGKRFPTAFAGFTDDATENILNDHLPPLYRAYRDQWNSRWQIQLGAGSTHHLSRSWGKYGFVGAARLACIAAWKHWEDQGNPPCPIDQLMMPGSGGLGSSSGSRAPERGAPGVAPSPAASGSRAGRR